MMRKARLFWIAPYASRVTHSYHMAKPLTAVSFSVLWHACIQCGACVAVCLQREPFISPFDTIAVETPCAIACMRCEQVCPTSAIISRAVQVA